MSLVLNEEQQILQRAARDFVRDRSSLQRVRAARDAGEGFSRELWREMARLGWLGLILPEAHGGAGLGRAYLMVVLEELGRGLLPEPVVPTVLLGAAALAAAGPGEAGALQREHLPAVAAGERLLALAHQEPGSRFMLAHVRTRAEAAEGGFVLRGEKIQVLGGAAADVLLVSARTSGGEREAHGVTLFAVPANAPGVRRERQQLLDGRDAARVLLEGVRVGTDALVGAPDEALGLLERVIDGATIGLCAEMLGSMSAAFAMTLDYLKTRVQFGVPIGSFQALQHRAARLYMEIELARAAVLEAHARFDQEAGPAAARAASAAKAKCSDAFLQVAHEGIQMHGGIGMTEEHDMGLFVKRARVAQMTFGDAAYHRDRFARLSGY